MSGKTSRKKRKDQKNAPLRQDPQTQERRKPSLVRLYDRLLPGEYTRKQDLNHIIIILAIICLIVGGIAFVIHLNVQKEETSVSASIVIPATSFVPGQEDNVVSTMAGYGFKEITKDEEGNYICYGTEEMVQAYKDSYRNDILAPVKTSMLNDHRAYCIEAISLSEDAKTLTIKTTEDLTEVSTLANYAFANQEIDRIIYVCSNWCQIANDGEKMTLNLEFVGESEPYYTCTPMNGGAVVAEIEASERAAKQAETDGGGTGTDENASTEGDEQEKAANEGGAPEE